MFLEQTLSLLAGVLQGVFAGVNVLVVVLGVITLDAGSLGYLDVVDEAAFLGLAIAEVQVGDAGLFASVNRVSQGYLEGAGGGLLVEAQVTDVSAVGERGVMRRSTPFGPLAVFTSTRNWVAGNSP